jgi:hypothetical protein
MSRLEVPLAFRRLRATGDLVVHAELVLAIIFPCYFLGDPDATAVRDRNLLGRTGVINRIRLIFDGTPSLIAQGGVLVVEKK